MSESFPVQSVSSTYQRWRLIKDALARHLVVVGGLSIIGAIVLIFFYLLYAVFPLFLPAHSESVGQYSVPEKEAGKTLFLALEEQNEVAARFTDQAQAVFFAVKDGKTLVSEKIALPTKTLPQPVPENSQPQAQTAVSTQPATAVQPAQVATPAEPVTVTSFSAGNPAKTIVGYGFADGRVLLVKHSYTTSYPDNVRVITPQISYPLGQEPLLIDQDDSAISQFSFYSDEKGTTVIAKTTDQRFVLTNFKKQTSLLDEEGTLRRTQTLLELPANDIAYMLIDKEQRNLYLANPDGHVHWFDISKKNKPALIQTVHVTQNGSKIKSLEFLNGDLSLLIGDSSGTVSQWSQVRDAENRPNLQKLRSFKVSDTDIVFISAEQRRKGFVAVDKNGQLGIYHTTAERELIKQSVTNVSPQALALAPRADAFLLEDQSGQIHVASVHNVHPEVSFKSLWQKVWYESYSKPDYVWQSSSASNDFEPKMSLTPLVFGTLKASFYAMLMAIPLALMGAIYTAYFMAPAMRQYVKPGIEMMGALPTVILGFLAGLWLAPFIEQNLAGIFALLMVVPLCVMLFAYFWQKLPETWRGKIPDGWDAAILIPVIIIASWLSFALSTPIEVWFFHGSLRSWLNSEFGIGYDQRNSLVVGLAMGFAVIPTIFSIAEDAIFSVPKHLTIGSLALGATPWQTMIKVVLLTASPGIFSAVMIGLGRAVGETMIVLMATGNTPIMDFSMFQGLRTLSANIAVEMPESEVDSTHYRVLFLAALVLFMFTFIFNTLAELIRQRLRKKYSSL